MSDIPNGNGPHARAAPEVHPSLSLPIVHSAPAEVEALVAEMRARAHELLDLADRTFTAALAIELEVLRAGLE